MLSFLEAPKCILRKADIYRKRLYREKIIGRKWFGRS
jgi:hypothetical protein